MSLTRAQQDFDDRTYKPARRFGSVPIGKHWRAEYTVAHDGTELVIEGIYDSTGVHGRHNNDVTKPVYEVVSRILEDHGTTFEAWVSTYRDEQKEKEEEGKVDSSISDTRRMMRYRRDRVTRYRR